MKLSIAWPEVGARPGVENRSPKSPSFQHGGSGHQSRASSDRAESLTVGIRELREYGSDHRRERQG